MSLSCVVTVAKLALHPREQAETMDIAGDRDHEEGALRPRLVPLREHEGGVRAAVQELLVEQDAVGELHCGSTQPGLSGNQMASVAQCFPSFCHKHQCLKHPFFEKKKRKINTKR